MLPWLVEFFGPSLFKDPDKLRLLTYISFRSAVALGLAFAISLLFGNRVIRWLGQIGAAQPVRKIRKEGAPNLHDMHGAKEGTPTMGGILIAGSLLLSVVLLADLRNPQVWVCILVVLGFGVIGFVDDYLKVTQRNHRGLSARVKLAGQILVGLGLAFYMMNGDLGIYYDPTETAGATHLLIPFFKNLYPGLGLFFVPWAILVVVSTSNAVNLTDGLDGLATGCAIVCTLAFTVVTYLVSWEKFATYLLLPHPFLAKELVVVLAALVGACMGFLWFNAHPARVFMGDIGSLTIGGLLGTIALLIRQEILLVIIGGIFVVEALSVVIQVTSYKTRGKRVFLMSPIHHHFEKKGLAESHIVVRFWIVAALLALVGMSTLKLR